MPQDYGAPALILDSHQAIAHETDYTRAPDGERIFTQHWRPARSPVSAVIVLSHGLGEHTDVYLPFVDYFASRGAAIYAHDHRGFGRSEGRRGHVPRYQRYVDDLLPLVRRARAENVGTPLVLVGHSMGGTIALLFTLRHPRLLDAAIYSAPALMVKVAIPLWKRTLGQAMSRVYPTYTNTGVSDPTLLTRDPALQQVTRDDTVRHTHVTARLYVEMFGRAPAEVFSRAKELRVPFLLLHGTEDPLVPAEASQRLYDLAVAAPVRDLRLYPGLRHEPFRELEREEVFGDVAAWLTAQGIVLTHSSSLLPHPMADWPPDPYPRDRRSSAPLPAAGAPLTPQPPLPAAGEGE